MKKGLLFFMFSFLLLTALKSQSVYTFRFRLQDSITCNAFMVIQPDGSGFVRYKKETALVEQQLEMKLTEPIGADEELRSVLYTAKKNRLVSGNITVKDFDFLFTIENEEMLPTTVTVAGSNGKQSAGSVSDITFITNEQLTKELVSVYFSSTEAFYINLFNTTTRALNALEKNTRIHLIIVANTADSTVGFAANKDMASAEQLFTDLTDVIGIKPMNVIKIYGAAYSRATVLAEIKKFKPQRNDIVVFYYSGHGFRTKKKTSVYPMIDLRSKPAQDYVKESLTIDTVMQLIKAKGARMNIVLGDCCNWDPEMPLPYVSADPQKRATNPAWDPEKSRALFLNPKRTNIIGIAATKNQLAVSNKKYGSFFFMYFRDALLTEISKSNTNKPNFLGWLTVFKSTETQTFRKSRNTYCSKPHVDQNICYQTPVFVIE
ncbi:hypothetical protein ESA94_15980 [Lacibacter luteus]|uniref:Peptidase C14 caspase domain-containing protein n=1 Tax=Lacibacter luteus TaxID=2508719 RepID=A0A4Q1CGI9_9BACT|nr:caspase family protein [Lacibacter luteus]RXK58885.1 hypothetical protein ESA94_15980 [Lacibacter luteus]